MEPSQYIQQPRDKNEENEKTECFSLEGDSQSYVPIKFPENRQGKALIDTGACVNVISEKDYEDQKSSFGKTTTISKPTEVSNINYFQDNLYLCVAKPD